MTGASVIPFEAGFTLHGDGWIMRATALRHDILRVQVGGIPRTQGEGEATLPEDASWAVLPAARAARHAVRAQADGFATEAMRVTADAAGGLTITDPAGRLIVADAAPFAAAGEGFRLTKTLPPAMHIFGLGEKPGPLDRRGRSFVMWNTDAYKYAESTDPLYKSIPFFVGFEQGRAYGLFLDNTFRTSFEFGVLHPERLSFGADGGAIDYYVMAGPSPKDVQRAYAWLTGLPPLPPLWSFGYQQSRFSYLSSAEIRRVAGTMRAHRLPCDVLWFDIDALDGHRPFCIDTSAFPDFPDLIKELREQGFHCVLITDLHVPSLPGEGYAPYDSGQAGDHFVHDAHGEIYLGAVWPGACCFPDFTRQATREWWGTLFAAPIFEDIAGIWNDMNEPSVFKTPSRTMPLDVRHRIEEPGFAPRAASHAEIHNVFGMQNARATHDGLRALRPGLRPMVMSRATYAGGHRTSVVWTGDNYAAWNHLRMSTPMLLSLGLGGFAFAGCDLGGFSGSPPPELLTRWLQLGMFNPIARNHSDKGTRAQEPWVDGEPHTTIRRRFIEERYRLLPYIYTLAEEASRTGLPMMRPLFMEFPDAAFGEALDLQAGHQFMWGEAMMVAPSPYPETRDPYPVILPAGDWYDYWTGLKLAGLPVATLTGGSGAITAAGGSPSTPRQVWVTPELDHLPVYVRAGSIIPRQGLVQHTGEVAWEPLELAVYPGPGCAGALYVDDGVSDAHRQGAFLRIGFRCAIAPDGAGTLSIGAREGTRPPWWGAIEVTIHGIDQPPRAPDARYDAARRTIRITVRDQSEGSTVRF